MVDVMIAPGHSGTRNTRPAIAAVTGGSTVYAVTFACGTPGSFQVVTEPRSASRSPELDGRRQGTRERRHESEQVDELA
jgi:hypothetical protein